MIYHLNLTVKSRQIRLISVQPRIEQDFLVFTHNQGTVDLKYCVCLNHGTEFFHPDKSRNGKL